jgi:ribonuclease P protein 1
VPEYVHPTDDPEVMREFSERTYQEHKVEDYEELIHSPKDRAVIEQCLKDYEFLKYTTDRAPTSIPVRRMAELMKLPSPSQKMNYFNFLFKTELKKLANRRARNKIGQAHMEKIRAEKDYETGMLFDPETREPIYRKWHNSMTMRIRDGKMDAVYDHKKQVAATFGQPFVIDCSFEHVMNMREILNTCVQLTILYGHNYRQVPDIFDLWFCNYRKDSVMHEKMTKAMPNIEFPNTMISLEERSYLDIFPKERIVYLRPHANNMIREFSHDDIYVMAGLVDKSIKTPVSLVKAKKEGIRYGRLPIDEHILWGSHSKVLTLNQIGAILLEAKNNGGDWKDAFLKHVPKRKLKTREEVAMEERSRLEKLTFQRKQFFKLH